MRYNIYNNGEFVNSIEASEEFAQTYCNKNGYTYEEIEVEPTTSDEITAEEALAILIGGDPA